MIRKTFDVIQEPRGDVLQKLIRNLAQRASSVLMVVRDDPALSEAGRGLLARLQPELVEQKRRSSWPGTILSTSEATVFRFTPSRAVLDELERASDGLYGWQQPALPEDLALLRDDGTEILASICHENDAYLEITDEEFQVLTMAVPALAKIICVRAPPASGHEG